MITKNETKQKTQKKDIDKGKIFISASFNNTLVTVTDMDGNTLVWGSSGNSGFKGTRKSTPYAATTAVDKVIKKSKEAHGLGRVQEGMRRFEQLEQQGYELQ